MKPAETTSDPPWRDEIEAKLLAPDERVLRDLAARPSIGRFRLRLAARNDLHSVYLDTADCHLLDAGIALRLRHGASGWEITAKWRGSTAGDVHTRREVSVPLGEAPRPPISLPPGVLRDELGPIIGSAPLEPLVVIDIDRQTLDVFEGKSRLIAEIALDVVRHSAPEPDYSWPAYYEVEVESADDRPEAVGEIAAELRAHLPLRPAPGTKFSRALQEVYGCDARRRR